MLMRLNIVTRFSYTMETIIQAGKKRLAIDSRAGGNQPQDPRIPPVLLDPAARVQLRPAIVRAYMMYKPYVIFGRISALFGALGLVPFVRYAVFVAPGEGGGHVQSLHPRARAADPVRPSA